MESEIYDTPENIVHGSGSQVGPCSLLIGPSGLLPPGTRPPKLWCLSPWKESLIDSRREGLLGGKV